VADIYQPFLTDGNDEIWFPAVSREEAAVIYGDILFIVLVFDAEGRHLCPRPWLCIQQTCVFPQHRPMFICVCSFPVAFNRFLAIARPSVCRLSSVTFVRPTQAIEIFGNVSMPFNTVAIC